MRVASQLCLLAAAVSLVVEAALAGPPEFEAPPVLDAPQVIGGLPLGGDGYAIDPLVPTDGFMATVTIHSDFGDFTASGPGMVQARLAEIRALAALEGIESDARFREAVEHRAVDTLENLRTLAENPGETLRGVPEGVGRFFDRAGRSLRTGAQKLGDVRQGQVPGVDPDVAPGMPGGAADAPDPAAGSFAQTAARAGGKAALNVLGFEEERRRLAGSLGVDPYTSNPVLAARLDEVTWAAFAGGLGVNIVTGLIPGGLIVSSSSRMSGWVWDVAPGDLRVGIVAQLRAVGVPEDQIDRFLRHQWYTLSMQQVLSEQLGTLGGVPGREAVIPLALGAASDGQARFVVQTLEMLGRYHATQAPLSALVVEGTVTGLRADGGPVVVAPVDVLAWTPVAAAFAGRFDGTTPVLHLSGQATDTARAAFGGLGWEMVEFSPVAPVAYPLR